MAINYLRRVQARYQGQGQSDVQRGIAAGEAAGKLLGGLGTAIQGAQKNALANKLMNTQDAPRAALVNAPGSGGDSGGPQPGPPDQGNTVDPGADLSTDLPEDVSSQLSTTTPTQTYTNPATGNIEPLQGQTPPTTYSGTNTDPLVASNVAAARLSTPSSTATPNRISATDWSKQNPNVSIFGTQQHTGGVQEMELQKEMLAMQMQKAQLARANAPAAPPDPLDQALKRVRLAQAQQNLQNPKGNKPAAVKPEDMPITNLDSEPVNNQAQLNKHVDTIYGKGTSGNLASTIMEPPTIDDPKNPGTQIPNPNAPQVSADGQTVTVGPKNKRVTMPIKTAQTLIKQQNSLNFKQNQPLLRVPGEDQTQGATANNPYPVMSKLDMVSRAHGTWVKLPNGTIAQVP